MKKSLEKKLKKLNVAIVSHIFATGPALDLEDYLKNKVSNLVFIGHPFSFSKTPASFLRTYSKFKLVKNTITFKLKIPEIFLYIKDAILTFYWILVQKNKIDLYFGSDGFLAFLGIILQKIGKVRRVVLYTIDFMPKRFQNPFLNWLYHFFDEQCLKHCKVVWNLSNKMAQGREEYMKVKRDKFVPQLTVPLGIWEKRIPKLPFEKKNRYTIAFMGHILKKQGLDIVIEALPKILKRLTKTKLLIIGTGDYEEVLKKKAQKIKVGENVNFTGYIKHHEDVEKMLSESIISVATYQPDPDSFTYFADPGKIKNYLSAGLPVILTDVPPIAKEIDEKKCGIIISYSSDDFARVIINFLSSSSKLKEYSRNAVAFAKKFDWENIFPKALDKTID